MGRCTEVQGWAWDDTFATAESLWLAGGEGAGHSEAERDVGASLPAGLGRASGFKTVARGVPSQSGLVPAALATLHGIEKGQALWASPTFQVFRNGAEELW